LAPNGLLATPILMTLSLVVISLILIALPNSSFGDWDANAILYVKCLPILLGMFIAMWAVSRRR
jgi:hypothetical protein